SITAFKAHLAALLPSIPDTRTVVRSGDRICDCFNPCAQLVEWVGGWGFEGMTNAPVQPFLERHGDYTPWMPMGASAVAALAQRGTGHAYGRDDRWHSRACSDHVSAGRCSIYERVDCSLVAGVPLVIAGTGRQFGCRPGADRRFRRAH